MENKMELLLTLDEACALKSIFYGLEGLTRRICKDYGVNSKDLLEKLETETDLFIRENAPGEITGYRG